MGNNQVAFDAVCCDIIGVDPTTVDHIRLASERGFGPMDLEPDQDHRRRHARGGQAARQGLQGRPDPRREVLRGHEHHRLRRPAARAGAHRLLLGRLPGRDRGGDRDPAPVRQGVRREDAAHARRVRRLRRRRSTPSPARRWCSSATARAGRARSTTSWCRSAASTRTARPRIPHHAKHEDISAKMRKTTKKLKESANSGLHPLRGLPGQRRRAGAVSRRARRNRESVSQQGKRVAVHAPLPDVEGRDRRQATGRRGLPKRRALPARRGETRGLSASAPGGVTPPTKRSSRPSVFL